MAEIRKHNPKTNTIADLVREALGAGPQPIQPGSTPPAATQDPDLYDPFDPGIVSPQEPQVEEDDWFALSPELLAKLEMKSENPQKSQENS